MIWGAPIWLNEILVTATELLVSISMIFPFVFLIYLIIGLFYKISARKNLNEYFKKKTLIVFIFGLVISITTVFIFLYPRDIVPNNYSFDKIKITLVENSMGNEKELVIEEKKALDELASILRDYKSVRSFDGGSIRIKGKVVFIDMLIFSNEKQKAFPLHLIIKENKQRVYTASNTDFIYIIRNKDGMFDNKIFDFVDRYYEQYYSQ